MPREYVHEIDVQLERLARFQHSIRPFDYARLEKYAQILLETIREAGRDTYSL